MASKENLYKTGKNVGRLALAGAALYGGINCMGNKNHAPDSNQNVVFQGQVLTQSEIDQLYTVENFMAKSAQIKPAASLEVSPVSTSEQKPQKMEIMSVSQMTTEQTQLIEKYKEELPNILLKINADEAQAEDLQIYYPIYRAAQDRYGVPWDLIWIIHEEESTASRNENAFKPGTGHIGAMQRAIQFHPQEDVDRANMGLKYLQSLPVRHSSDASEIIWAASAVNEWAGEQRDYHRALLKYSAREFAEERYQKFLVYQAELGN